MTNFPPPITLVWGGAHTPMNANKDRPRQASVTRLDVPRNSRVQEYLAQEAEGARRAPQPVHAARELRGRLVLEQQVVVPRYSIDACGIMEGTLAVVMIFATAELSVPLPPHISREALHCTGDNGPEEEHAQRSCVLWQSLAHLGTQHTSAGRLGSCPTCVTPGATW